MQQSRPAILINGTLFSAAHSHFDIRRNHARLD